MSLPPGSTIGIVGGGQLGRMLAIAAARLGYKVHIYAPDQTPPAAEVSAFFTRGEWTDFEGMRRFGEQVDLLTYEFENVDPHFLAPISGSIPVRPSVFSLDVSRYRPNEKQFAERAGGRCAPWRVTTTAAELEAAVTSLGTPAILKSSLLGYDGKGQSSIDDPAQASAAWKAIGQADSILERRIDFIGEFSVILCRSADGAIVEWPSPENVHAGGVLVRSTIPARAEIEAQVPEARRLARDIAERLGHIGVLTLEFFATRDGPLFNEMAPRVHNSGHWTIEGAVTSQFENHIRAVCGLPLGSTALSAPRVEMENLIGDDVLRWRDILAEPDAHLHLYGKGEPRPGRKMGHVTRLRT
jgi:5-(carboxyamino)imidazole ribonucleotide synthase